MATEVQFLAITAFLIWGLMSSVCGLFMPSATDGHLIWREHGGDGWRSWRRVHYGLTTADQRVLRRTGGEPSASERAGLLDTVLQQARRPDTDAVQFAIVRGAPERVQTAPFVVVVSEPIEVLPDRWEVALDAA